MSEVLWMESRMWCMWISLEPSRLAKGAKIGTRCAKINFQVTS